ncbi:MAG: His/Gly/Thr/Pro-type tRNA ligase C-terminal domain-containing protein, partial [Candidatus Latescibacterota bacterium]
SYNGVSMVWPREIAPFLVEIVPLNVTHEETRTLSEDLYTILVGKNISVLLDDRDERAGVKFKDADLFGAPIEVVVGEKNLKDGFVEIRVRDKGMVEKVPVGEITAYIFDACDG